jgi:transcriptional regulator with XRE-family HTH domain
MRVLRSDYSERLREAMVSYGLRREDLTDVVDVPLSRVNEILDGDAHPSPETRDSLEKALDCDISVLVCDCCGEREPDLDDGFWDVGGRIYEGLLCADCRRTEDELQSLSGDRSQ